MLPKSVIHKNSLEIFLLNQLRILKDKYVDEVVSEISNRKLIEFKGYINIKSFFKTTFSNLTGFFKTKRTQNEIKKFVKNFLEQGVDLLEKEIGANVDGVDFTTSQITKSTQAKDIGNYVYELITGMNTKMTQDIRSEVSRGILNGESMSKIIKRINKVSNKIVTNAKTIARTEAARITNEGTYLAAKNASIKLRKYVSVTLDNRTSPICKRMNNKYGNIEESVPLSQKFTSIDGSWMTPPFHCSCRTALMIVTQAEYDELK